MSFGNRKRPYVIPLLVFFIVISITATAILMKSIVDYGYRQFGRVVQESIKLARDYSQNSFQTMIERQSLWIEDSFLSKKITNILESYNENGNYTYELFPEQWMKFQEDQAKAHFGYEAEIEYEIIHSDKTILYSTIGNQGKKFIILNKHSQERYNNFINNRNNENFLIYFETRHLKGNVLNILIPFNVKESYLNINIKVKNIDMDRIFRLSRIEVFPGIIYLVNPNGEVIVRSNRNKKIYESIRGIKLPETLLSNIKSKNTERNIELISYKNNGKPVVGIGTWIGLLDIGIILEIPSSIILGPWYFLGGIIVIISVVSMLIFLIISIIMDKKRLRAFDFNPLTHLPGNQLIIEKIENALKINDQIIVYCDLDNFKAYNDCYGFSAGDSVITYSAKLLQKTISGSRKIFLGHIGGDDFVVVGNKEIVKKLLERFGLEFDSGIIDFYSEDDKKRGYIAAKDRQGKDMKFPFVAMSMGGLELNGNINIHPLKVAELCAEVKKIAKKEHGSKLVINRRSLV